MFWVVKWGKRIYILDILVKRVSEEEYSRV